MLLRVSDYMIFTVQGSIDHVYVGLWLQGSPCIIDMLDKTVTLIRWTGFIITENQIPFKIAPNVLFMHCFILY